jgi:valyl-tRNA synthetase
VGEEFRVPLFGQKVTVRTDPAANPEVGTGAVMCCTFGDTVDKHWWYSHQLDHVEAIDRQGKLTQAAGEFAGLPVAEARQLIKERLSQTGLLIERQPTSQVIPVHERCDTPVEILMSQQWFIRLLDFKDEFLAAADQIAWYPGHMKQRYISWVENLAWDWCISRQRYYGIRFPLWYCQSCGDVILADEDQLPVDPTIDQPNQPCRCGGSEFIPEEDFLETWATSSMTPQIVGRWLCDDQDQGENLFEQVYPFSLRPQAHEIIRTWAFYTIVKSHYHLKEIPWKEIAISGWGIAGEGMGKISKSKGGGPLPPHEMIDRYSADAVRYWAVSTGLGKDAIINEEKIQMGGKLATKLWNVARFSERFLIDYAPPEEAAGDADFIYSLGLTPADRWILSRLQRVVQRSTRLLENYDYAAAKSEIENYFWNEFADNYLEMCKQRLYTGNQEHAQAAQFTLYTLLLTISKLLAPFLPYITESIYQGLFAESSGSDSAGFASIHLSDWPKPNPNLEDDYTEQVGGLLVEIATAVRRFKSENSLSLGTDLQRLQIAAQDARLADELILAEQDLLSITRAKEIDIGSSLDSGLISITFSSEIQIGLKL